MEKKQITIHDLAEILGINASTVSRALSNSSRVSEKTKLKVRNKAKELNYQPNLLASNLRKGKSKNIGVIIPKINRQFFSNIIVGIESVAKKNNYSVIITQTNESYENEVKAIDTFINTRIDCVLASHSIETTDFSHFEKLKNAHIPLVFFDRVPEKFDAAKVVINDFDVSYKTVTHLIKGGAKRILHFTGNRNVNVYKNRFEGYKKALLDNKIEFDESFVISNSISLKDGVKEMGKIVETNNLPDAIFCASDYVAMGVMSILKEHNIKIPDQVAVVGFANEAFCSFIEPSLTTIDQFGVNIGEAAANLFFDKENKIEIIESELIIRNSTKN